MKPLILLLFTVFYIQVIYSQDYFIRGSVKAAETGEALSYTNIRVDRTTQGTSSNKKGEFELKLKKGKYDLIASYIGYQSDTIAVNVNQDLESINFSLNESKIELPEIVVRPGENPALEIIRKAIAEKNKRKSKLKSYEFEAYTKGLLLTQHEINAGNSSLTLSISTDTSTLKITGILENQSKGFFKSPDDYKEEIVARKQSANFPPTINIFTGGRLVQNFYEDNINFIGSDLPGPISDEALDYYDYYIKNTLAMNDQTVYQIEMRTQNSSDPGFTGDIFITDKSYDLIKVNLQLNKSANTGGIFDTINVFQQFSMYSDSVYMPVDFRLFVKANYLGLAKFGFELNTILYDYKINPNINDAFFDKAVITVLPNADDKDSTYWLNSQTIPNTIEEQKAYTRIDSISNIKRSFWEDFSVLSTRLYYTDNFSSNGPLGFYHFNKVDGHSIGTRLYLENMFKNRSNSLLRVSYGFANKKFKYDFNTHYLLGDYRTYNVSLNVFDRTSILFGDRSNFLDFGATWLALLFKYEFRDYYYSNGFNIKLSGEVFPVLGLNLKFQNRTDNNSFVNSNFSFFKKDEKYSQNPPINEVKLNTITAGFSLDFRDYIEDGLFRRRIFANKSFILINGDVTFSNKNFLNSALDFTTYKLSAAGRLNSFGSTSLGYEILGIYNNGILPFQNLYSLNGNIEVFSQNFSFRTLAINEVVGDRVFTANLEYYFGSELFRILRIPGIKDWDIQLTAFLNSALSMVSDGTKSIILADINTFAHPFYELGFSIGHALFPFQLDFAWKLNYRGNNNFVFLVNTPF